MKKYRKDGPIWRAVQAIGSISAAARALGVSNNAVRKWLKAQRLPRTEATGETNYAAQIAAAQSVVATHELIATVMRKREGVYGKPNKLRKRTQGKTNRVAGPGDEGMVRGASAPNRDDSRAVDETDFA